MSTKILVVEDEVIVAEDITKTLSDLGYVVTSVVKSGHQAIERVKIECPDLVLMDIVLKGKLDGVQVADIIRKEYKIPVVYLTAHADITTLERAKATEPFGYLLPLERVPSAGVQVPRARISLPGLRNPFQSFRVARSPQ